MARRRCQKGSVFCSSSRQVWLRRYREDALRPDGIIIRSRPQVVLGTKQELPTRRLALRKLDAILARINDPRYEPSRTATVAEFATRWVSFFAVTSRALPPAVDARPDTG